MNIFYTVFKTTIYYHIWYNDVIILLSAIFASKVLLVLRDNHLEEMTRRDILM